MSPRAAVLGLGLIGGSLAAALVAAGYRVSGYDIAPGARQIALERGLVTEACSSSRAAVEGVEVVLLAMPVMAIFTLLPEVDDASSPTALILDTGSVKGPVVEVMRTLRHPERAIGGHPLAGDVRSGPAAAGPALLAGHPFVLCPSTSTSGATITAATELVGSVGMIPRLVDAEEHDRVLARTSHLPQLLSSGLAMSLEPGDACLAGPALERMTHLAASDTRLWADIAIANRSAVVAALSTCIAHLETVVREIDAGDHAAIEQWLRRGVVSQKALKV